MDNIQIEADLWLSCGECLNEIDEQGNVNSPKEYAKFQVGIEFETNSLIVDCLRPVSYTHLTLPTKLTV